MEVRFFVVQYSFMEAANRYHNFSKRSLAITGQIFTMFPPFLRIDIAVFDAMDFYCFAMKVSIPTKLLAWAR